MALANPHGGGDSKPLPQAGEYLISQTETRPRISESDRKSEPHDSFMNHTDWQSICSEK